jgi:hypothetical protein
MALSDYVDYGYSKAVWDNLMTYINNPIGVAAMMGNLFAESGIVPYRCEKDNNSTNKFLASKNYTKDVDSGVVSENAFVNGGLYEGKPGYGLAQWSYYSRKQALYNMWKNGNYDSIGNIDLALAYLKSELETHGYNDTLSVLQNATDIRAASNHVLFYFENPTLQGQEVQDKRYAYSQDIYDTFNGSAPIERKSLTISPISASIVDGDTLTINVNASGEWTYNLGQYLSLVEKTDGALVVSGNANAAQITTAIAFWLIDDASIQTQCQIGINRPAPPAPSIRVTPYSQTANVNTVVRFMVSANRAWSVRVPSGASLYRKDGNSVYIKIANTALTRIVLRFYINDDVNVYQDVPINILGVSPVPSGRKTPFIYYLKPFLGKVR